MAGHPVEQAGGPLKKLPPSAALTALRLSNMARAPRCLARTRKGTPCQRAVSKGRKRCHCHGGAKNSGAPVGERNGAFKTGEWTNEAVALRRQASAAMKAARAARKTQ